MKNIFAALYLLVQGIGSIFDFAGYLQEENLHEKQDLPAIKKDWHALKTDYSETVKKITGGINVSRK